MSGGLKALQPTDDDITKLLMGKAHIGTKNCDFQVRSRKRAVLFLTALVQIEGFSV